MLSQDFKDELIRQLRLREAAYAERCAGGIRDPFEYGSYVGRYRETKTVQEMVDDVFKKMIIAEEEDHDFDEL